MVSIDRDYYFNFEYRYQLYLYFIAVGDNCQGVFETFLKNFEEEQLWRLQNV